MARNKVYLRCAQLARPPGSKNKPKQNVPTEPAAPKRKPKPPVSDTGGGTTSGGTG